MLSYFCVTHLFSLHCFSAVGIKCVWVSVCFTIRDLYKNCLKFSSIIQIYKSNELKKKLF